MALSSQTSRPAPTRCASRTPASSCVDFEGGVGTSVIDGGIAQNITLDLKPGRYAVVCFISDRKGGKPHVAKGMIDEVVVE